jgi:uncharacterized membrane protein
MVTVRFDETLGIGRIVLRPNRSWTWRANTYLLATLMLVSTLIAGGFALRGMWMVLPFSTLEMSVLLACLYYCVRRTHRQEVLTFSAQDLVVEQGHHRPERTVRFERFWTRVFVEHGPHPWYADRIALRSRGREVEIGSFLSAPDKEDLVKEIRRIIRQLDS